MPTVRWTGCNDARWVPSRAALTFALSVRRAEAIVNFREGYTSGKPQLGVCVRKVGTGQVSETTDGTGRQKGSRTRYRANFGACRYRSVIVLRNLGCNFILYFLLCSGACRHDLPGHNSGRSRRLLHWSRLKTAGLVTSIQAI